MTTIEVLCICALNLLSVVAGLVIGVAMGQKVARQEKIEVNPVKAVKQAVKEHKEVKEKEAEDEYIKAILHNIEVYDGTGVGQVKVPKRK